MVSRNNRNISPVDSPVVEAGTIIVTSVREATDNKGFGDSIKNLKSSEKLFEIN